MIKKIVIENMRSVKKASVSFEKTNISYRDMYVFRGKYLNPITLYGDNGSGKSMFLYAVKQLVLIMNYDDSTVARETDVFPDILPLARAYAKNQDKSEKVNVSAPTLSFTFLTKDGKEFVYKLVSMAASILHESLSVRGYNNGRPFLIRNGNEYSVTGKRKKQEINDSYSAVRQIGIEEYQEPGSPNAMIKDCFECMRKVVYIDTKENIFGYRFNSTKNPKDVMLESDFVASHVSRFSSLPAFKFFLENDAQGKKSLSLDFGEETGTMPFPFVSDGVMSEARLLSALKVASEDEDSVVVVDEINRSVHPINLSGLVDEFVSKGVQLFFSSHETSLMKSLRPDQIYFSYLKPGLESVYFRLSDLHPNIREINNIETMYLKGVFDEDLREQNN